MIPMRVHRRGGVLVGGGVRVVSVTRAATGLTLILLPEGAVGSVDVRGGAPATREVELLHPENLVPGPDAVLLTGGSAFGLAAADGVMEVLVASGRGFPAGTARVPIVPTLAIFDLGGPEADVPAAEDGRAAARQALRGSTARVPEGRAGAGTGATVGKHTDGRPMKGGQGAAAVEARGLTVSALMVVNAIGSVVDADGRVLAGPVGQDGVPRPWIDCSPATAPGVRDATTIGVVVVDGALDKVGLRRVAMMAHDGLARAVNPAHTPWDGDALVAVALGGPAADAGWAGVLAAEATAAAVRRAAVAANV